MELERIFYDHLQRLFCVLYRYCRCVFFIVKPCNHCYGSDVFLFSLFAHTLGISGRCSGNRFRSAVKPKILGQCNIHQFLHQTALRYSPDVRTEIHFTFGSLADILNRNYYHYGYITRTICFYGNKARCHYAS